MQPKKRTFKKFSYRSVDLDTLLDMTSEELVNLFHARARRRFQRGLKRQPKALVKKLRKVNRLAPAEFSISYKPVKHGRPGRNGAERTRNPRLAASMPSAANESWKAPAAEGYERLKVSRLSEDLQDASDERTILLAERSGVAWPQPPAFTSRVGSPLQEDGAAAKGDHAEPFAASPRIVASGKEGRATISCTPLSPMGQIQETKRNQGVCLLSSQICRGKRHSDFSSSFQIQIKLITGKTMLQWVSQTDLVQNIKHALNIKLGIPSAVQRLLYEGKQLEDLNPISFYSIKKDASIILTLRLRGGAAGESSSDKAFSYKDAVHAKKPEKTAPPVQAPPKPFLVDKSEEVPSIEISYSELADDTQKFAERAIICRFNGLWPRSKDLYDWIKENWTHSCKIYFCVKGYFIVLFDELEHYENALEEGPWFMGMAGLFLTPWFPDFDPASAVITKAPVWIRLPNLPIHLWCTKSYRQIGNALGCFLMGDYERERQGLFTYARICVELDLSKGFPEQINLKINDTVWTQFLDYENTAFRCRHCHLTGHLQNSCPSQTARSKKGSFAKTKPKRWAPCPPPPARSSSSPSSEKGERDSEPDQAPQPMDQNMDTMGLTHDTAISQKRAHETSSESDKEVPMIENSSLQIVLAHPPHDGWTKVNKKKGKKQCVVVSAPMG